MKQTGAGKRHHFLLPAPRWGATITISARNPTIASRPTGGLAFPRRRGQTRGDMDQFSEEFVLNGAVTYWSVDREQTLLLRSLFEFLQEAAIKHADQFGAGTGVLLVGALVGFVVGRFLKVTGLSFFDRLLGAGFGVLRAAVIAVVVVAGLMAFSHGDAPPAAVTLPEPVSLKRFLAPEWVFCLGICLVLRCV